MHTQTFRPKNSTIPKQDKYKENQIYLYHSEIADNQRQKKRKKKEEGEEYLENQKRKLTYHTWGIFIQWLISCQKHQRPEAVKWHFQVLNDF